VLTAGTTFGFPARASVRQGAIYSYNGSMKTTIDIPDDELREVVRNTGAATKREAVVTAIEDYNRRKRLAKVARNFGTMKGFMTRDELQRLRRDR